MSFSIDIDEKLFSATFVISFTSSISFNSFMLSPARTSFAENASCNVVYEVFVLSLIATGSAA